MSQNDPGDEKMKDPSETTDGNKAGSLAIPHNLSSFSSNSFSPIDLSTPLPVTYIGACSSHTSTDGSGPGAQLDHVQYRKHLHQSSLKSRRIKCREQIFYKVGLKSLWSDKKKLITAIQNSEVSKVSELLDLGANPNVCDQKKRTPLHVAASQGQSHIVGLLLSKKADPTCQDILGNTPLHLAVCRGDLPTVKMLIENGSNIFMKDNSGRTPLSLVRNRLGGLRRSKSTRTDAFKSEFILMSELLCSPAAHLNDQATFVTSIDDLCNQMQSVSTRERADEITDAAIQHMTNAVSAMGCSSISLL